MTREEELQQIKDALGDAEKARPWLPNGSLLAMAEHESDLSPRADNGSRVGLLQVSEDDLTRVGLDRKDGFDWRNNVRAGLLVLDELYSKFENPILAMTAYRAGSGKTTDWQAGNQKLSRKELEYAPSIIARSTKHGGVATHNELLTIAGQLGLDNLDGIYARAGLSKPELPRGANVTGETLETDPNVQEALDRPISRVIEEDKDGKRRKGVDITAREAFRTLPGAPRLQADIDRDDQLMSDITEEGPDVGVPPQLAQALGLPNMQASLGIELDRIVEQLWDDA